MGEEAKFDYLEAAKDKLAQPVQVCDTHTATALALTAIAELMGALLAELRAQREQQPVQEPKQA